MTEAEVLKFLNQNPHIIKPFDCSSQLECDIARWIITHRSGLIRKILLTHNSGYHLFPANLIDIYLDNYADNILTIIKREIQNHLNLNPEEISLIVTQDWLKLLLGHKFFIPPK